MYRKTENDKTINHNLISTLYLQAIRLWIAFIRMEFVGVFALFSSCISRPPQFLLLLISSMSMLL